jgi:hypothetical protein
MDISLAEFHALSKSALVFFAVIRDHPEGLNIRGFRANLLIQAMTTDPVFPIRFQSETLMELTWLIREQPKEVADLARKEVAHRGEIAD